MRRVPPLHPSVSHVSVYAKSIAYTEDLENDIQFGYPIYKFDI